MCNTTTTTTTTTTNTYPGKPLVESLAIPITSRLLYQLYHEGSNEELATNLFLFVLEVLPAEMLPNLRPFLSELFALHGHRGSLSLFLHPLLEKLVFESIEVLKFIIINNINNNS
jgi:hypothetical protein